MSNDCCSHPESSDSAACARRRHHSRGRSENRAARKYRRRRFARDNRRAKPDREFAFYANCPPPARRPASPPVPAERAARSIRSPESVRRDARDASAASVCRTSSSAVAVTVQVFRTIRSAPDCIRALVKPRAVNPASIAAPSAWDARQPKFLIAESLQSLSVSDRWCTNVGCRCPRAARVSKLAMILRRIVTDESSLDGGLRARARLQPRFRTAARKRQADRKSAVRGSREINDLRITFRGAVSGSSFSDRFAREGRPPSTEVHYHRTPPRESKYNRDFYGRRNRKRQVV